MTGRLIIVERTDGEDWSADDEEIVEELGEAILDAMLTGEPMFPTGLRIYYAPEECPKCHHVSQPAEEVALEFTSSGTQGEPSPPTP